MNQKQSWESEFDEKMRKDVSEMLHGSLKAYAIVTGGGYPSKEADENEEKILDIFIGLIQEYMNYAISKREKEISDWLYTLKAQGENEDEMAGFSKAIDLVYLSIINNK